MAITAGPLLLLDLAKGRSAKSPASSWYVTSHLGNVLKSQKGVFILFYFKSQLHLFIFSNCINLNYK